MLAAARQLGVPSGFVELAYAADRPRFPVPPDLAAAGSEASRATVAALTGRTPTVVGQVRPARSQLPDARAALLLPIRTGDTPDGQALLTDCALRLAAAGWTLTVATHPREDRPVLDGVAVNVDGLTSDRQLAGVDLVVGTTTTRMVDAVAAGRPVLRVPSGLDRLDGHPTLRHCGPLVGPDEAAAAAETAVPLADDKVVWLAGPDDPASMAGWLRTVAG